FASLDGLKSALLTVLPKTRDLIEAAMEGNPIPWLHGMARKNRLHYILSSIRIIKAHRLHGTCEHHRHSYVGSMLVTVARGNVHSVSAVKDNNRKTLFRVLEN